MSKLYKRYLELKKQDLSKIYLFKSGIFYIFLDDDARKMAGVLNLRLTNLNESVLKCGFPVNNLNKYLELVRNMGYDICLVDTVNDEPLSSKNYLLNSNIQKLIHNLSLVDSNQLSISEAYSLIEKVNYEAKEIEKEMQKK